ncbi:MAG: DUF2851 family protein [Candidatus Didemnitutus sp.]|nr:DUF2851 family protein [Candidatus Didemnitutus sp.]
MAASVPIVAEMQGMYGPFTMAERVLQKIWLQQDFVARGVVLTDGRSLEVSSPGRWNLLGGPDFLQARLSIAGREVVGDVEVHFYSSDWQAHGHRANPAYRHVVLHVLLFPPAKGSAPARRGDGTAIPVLVLLPLLHRDLEEYVTDDALEAVTARDDWRRIAELNNLPGEQVRELLCVRARQRWVQKLGYASQRIAKLGWEAAAHCTALEILGYRRNRVPMLLVAGRWPLGSWRDGREVEEYLATAKNQWERQGVRPANHPATRLAQYAVWTARSPDWPTRLGDWAGHRPPWFPRFDASTAAIRRDVHFKLTQEFFRSEIMGEAVGGSRCHTLVCDGLLPLAAAWSGKDLSGLWFHWHPGDLPEQIRRAVRDLGVCQGRSNPLNHGCSQGMLAWLIEREVYA